MEKNKCEHKHADHRAWKTCSVSEHISDTCRCSHRGILWDTDGPLFLLAESTATVLPGPAWLRRIAAPGLEEGGVAGG